MSNEKSECLLALTGWRKRYPEADAAAAYDQETAEGIDALRIAYLDGWEDSLACKRSELCRICGEDLTMHIDSKHCDELDAQRQPSELVAAERAVVEAAIELVSLDWDENAYDALENRVEALRAVQAKGINK